MEARDGLNQRGKRAAIGADTQNRQNWGSDADGEKEETQGSVEWGGTRKSHIEGKGGGS